MKFWVLLVPLLATQAIANLASAANNNVDSDGPRVPIEFVNDGTDYQILLHQKRADTNSASHNSNLGGELVDLLQNSIGDKSGAQSDKHIVKPALSQHNLQQLHIAATTTVANTAVAGKPSSQVYGPSVADPNVNGHVNFGAIGIEIANNLANVIDMNEMGNMATTLGFMMSRTNNQNMVLNNGIAALVSQMLANPQLLGASSTRIAAHNSGSTSNTAPNTPNIDMAQLLGMVASGNDGNVDLQGIANIIGGGAAVNIAQVIEGLASEGVGAGAGVALTPGTSAAISEAINNVIGSGDGVRNVASIVNEFVNGDDEGGVANIAQALGIRNFVRTEDKKVPDGCPSCFNCMYPGSLCAHNATSCLSPVDKDKRPSAKNEHCHEDTECRPGWGGWNCNTLLVKEAGVTMACYVGNTDLSRYLPEGVTPKMTFGCDRNSSACSAQFWISGKEAFYCDLDQMKCKCIPGRFLCGNYGLDISTVLNEVEGPVNIKCHDDGFSNCFIRESQKIITPQSSSSKRTSSESEMHSEISNMMANTLRATVSFRDISYTIPAQGPDMVSFKGLGVNISGKVSLGLQPDGSSTSASETKGMQLLKNVNGIVRPGEILAILGASGAGKSTLLDILSRREKCGKVTGKVQINDKDIIGDITTEEFHRMSGYVDQQDVHVATATVHESVMTSALLRLPRDMSLAAKEERVRDVLIDLGYGIANQRGNEEDPNAATASHTGSSSSIDKKTSSDSEWSPLLGTSTLSLDATSLETSSSKKHGTNNPNHKSVNKDFLATQQQPKGSQFIVYNARINLQRLLDSFKASNQYHQVSGELDKVTGVDWVPSSFEMVTSIAVVIFVNIFDLVYLVYCRLKGKNTGPKFDDKLRPSLFEQYKVLSARIFRHLYRDPTLMLANYAMSRANAYYDPMAYFLAKVTFDLIPLRVVPPMLLTLILYPMAGLAATWHQFIKFFCTLVIFNLTIASQMFFIGLLAEELIVSNFLASLTLLFSLLFGGLILNKESIPAMLQPLFGTSIFNLAYEALSINELRYAHVKK
ncbi:hypothetical protein BX661DRAFT_224942 [Kickxella alabastrina]|uniref:uncharacterized protein n=1 Tax=Kickxella alabastrina TaxID=61397 RepID=UPI0022208165|nr:uncharacterized protein BX661DRAFT_224942 [Kickxella alabastrina]KAI7826786.1 hypothetical protein BX661DRAFT_224942 [Kickxella alabastrina]